MLAFRDLAPTPYKKIAVDPAAGILVVLQLAKLISHAPLNFHFCRINIGAVGATAESKTEHPNKSDFANFHWAQAALCQGSWEGDACTSGA
jgi:hypothetical protein